MRSLLALTSILCLAVACGDDDGPPADTGRDVPANVDTNRQDTNMQDTNGQDTNMQDANSSGMCPASHMCDLVSQDCSGDDGCYFGVDMDGNSLGVCASPGTAAFGETCDAAAACVAGRVALAGPVYRLAVEVTTIAPWVASVSAGFKVRILLGSV